MAILLDLGVPAKSGERKGSAQRHLVPSCRSKRSKERGCQTEQPLICALVEAPGGGQVAQGLPGCPLRYNKPIEAARSL
jgi:hypothetical protein